MFNAFKFHERDANNKNTPCNFTSSGISAEAKQKIAKVRWNTGTFATFSTSEWTASATYEAERGNIDGKQLCTSNGGGFGCNDEVERTTKLDGYIGLVHPSDFGYAVGKSVRETCLAKSMSVYYKYDCVVNDWLKPSRIEWLLNPVPSSLYGNTVFYLSSYGVLDYFGYSSAPNDVWPVAYLKSSTTITDALGTQEDPFIAS